MDSRFTFVLIFLIFCGFVCTTGNINLEINEKNEEEFFNQLDAYAAQPITLWNIAHPFYNLWQRIYNIYPITYTLDFDFPIEIEPLTLNNLQGINVRNEGGFLKSETHAPQPVTSGHIAQAPQPVTLERIAQVSNKSQQSIDINPVTYTPDFVFPDFVSTEDPTEVKPLTLTKLQDLQESNETRLLKMRSEQKCEEYAREIEIKTGMRCTINSTIFSIVGGTVSEANEFPHMVALGKHNSDKTFTLICGGTLISYTWILSAAHCTYGSNGSPSHARLGFNKLTESTGVVVGIKRMIRHPEYKPPLMYSDIALIELVDKVTFSTSIRPACLFQQHYYAPTTAWITGWGVTEFAGEHSDPLLKAEVDLINNLECRKAYSDVREVPYGIIPSMLCAGDARGNWSRDTCQGDSGGPLQNQDFIHDCLFHVIGITSLGLGCAIINTPGVYTNVSYYVPWIVNIVWPEE